MTSTATDTSARSSELSPASFVLPDPVTDCPYPFALILISMTLLAPPNNAGKLGAFIYPDADAFHLRVCSDFLNWLFNVDDWLEEFDVSDTLGMRDSCIGALRDPNNFQTEKLGAKMAKSFFGRVIQTGGPGCTERFIRTMDEYFTAVVRQVDYLASGHIPDLESYIALRRDTSAVKPSCALAEYAACIDLPDEVKAHPVIQSWSNDIYSYNVEQCRGEPHNLIIVLMHHQEISLQDAVDYAGALCKGSIQRFEENRAVLPSWGEEIDRQVASYVESLQDWMVGSLHWSFESERYFGKEGPQVKQTRIVKLLPKRSH
ncbi:isoprenoid synthase domain-containing protein [Melanogaster broomeanus]|nr:isoprenoid synthase domain-containing protein [Melanogaster broomeanus]